MRIMKQGFFRLIDNAPIAPGVYRMILGGDTSAVTAPGQFVNILLEGRFLRRPISVCDCAPDKLSLVYKVVGAGTAQMAALRGGELDVLTGLGNGYDMEKAGPRPLLIGGGAGVPPLYMLCRLLMERGVQPHVLLGFNTASEIFLERELRSLGAEVTVTTADGSFGTPGFVTDAMDGIESTYFYACGPEPMLRAVCQAAKTSGQLSFEERMGCGFGACMGCTCKTKYGDKRICRDGPVLEREEVIW